ncbi:MAG: 50S ribosomal protein L15 [Planctomycetota bacterium]
MNLSEVNERAGRYKTRKRLGRGYGSGLGKTSGRGQKGAKARTGYQYKFGYEGGQFPMYRRLPKRGFNNVFRIEYDIVNLSELSRCKANQTINLETLVTSGVLKSRHGRLKVLARGELKGKYIVEAAKFSAAAKRRIEELGGQAKEI